VDMQPPWIAEMYGYVFGATEVNLTHTLNRGRVEYAKVQN